MELRHLRYFTVVAEEQSFTKASEKLFIAQPPLSRQIQNLEGELGILLFERKSRPLQLTKAGRFFYQHAIKLLSQAEEIKTMTKRVGMVQRAIKIGFVGSLLYGILPQIIYSFRQRHPHLKVELVEIGTKDQIAALKEGRIDVGFGRLKISDPAVKRILLREEPLLVAIHSSHPIAKMKTGVYLADIVDEHLFLYPNHGKPNFSNHIKNIFSEHGLEPDSIEEVREVQLALGLVAAGEGICIVPSSATNIKFTNLHYIPLKDDSAVSPIFIAIRNMDENEDLKSIFECVYHLYNDLGIQYTPYNFHDNN